MDSSLSVDLVLRFWREVWSPPYNIGIIDELLSEEFTLVNAGSVLHGRPAFKQWVKTFGARIGDVRLEPLDTFSNADGTKVASTWTVTGTNNGMFGLPPDGAPLTFTGMSVWTIQNGKLTGQRLERSAFELFQRLTAAE